MQRSDEREAETTTGSDKSLTGSDQNLDFDVESDIGSDIETDFGSEVASKTSKDNRRLPTIRSLVFVIVASAIGFLGGGSVPIAELKELADRWELDGPEYYKNEDIPKGLRIAARERYKRAQELREVLQQYE